MLQLGGVGDSVHFGADEGGDVAADLVKIRQEEVRGYFPDDWQFFVAFFLFGQGLGVVENTLGERLVGSQKLRDIVWDWNSDAKKHNADYHYVVRNLRIYKRKGKRGDSINGDELTENLPPVGTKFDIFG